MVQGIQHTPVPRSFRILAGMETGVLAGLAMLGWFLVSSALLGQSVWIIPNLLGSILSRAAVLRSDFSGVTLSGLSLHFFTAGVAGIMFGLLAEGLRSRRRVMLFGVISGLIWFYFSSSFIWRKLGALAWVYSSPRLLLVGHLIFGIGLGFYPMVLEAGLRRLTGAPEPKSPSSLP